MRVLIIDDDHSYSLRVKTVLEERNFTVQIANSLAEARAELGSAGMDLVILDLKIPGGGGLQLLPTITELQPTPKVLIHSGFASAQTIAVAFKQGASEYLPKPATGQEIVAAINSLKDCQTESRDTEQQIRARYPTLEDMEREFLHRVLLECDGNVSKAARAVGLHRRSLQRKLSRWE
jgi:two-component system response regulator RegA